ncbi:MAG TPA: choice-of-anchor P family protein [Acidimicrobiia bacterium]|nr:choice-of-anchor P family protein [Acidimicrobiia bacterium]
MVEIATIGALAAWVLVLIGLLVVSARRAGAGGRRRVWVVAAIAALAGAGMPFAPSLATDLPGVSFADHSKFEIEGNRADDTGPGDPLDWNSPEVDPTQGGSAILFTDPTGEFDNSFNGGSKEFLPDTTWLFSVQQVPQKDDILHGGVFKRDVDGATWLSLFFERKANSGDAFLNFEFNQTDDTYVNSLGAEIPARTEGDLLAAIFVSQGGQTTNIEVRRWVGNHLSGEWVLTGVSAVRGTDWEAATNADPKGRWTFAEAALRVDKFGLQPSCPGFGHAWIKSTSSKEFGTAALKDRTVREPVNLSNCATKHWEFDFSPQPIAGASVFALYTVDVGGPNEESRSTPLLDADGDGVFTATDAVVPPGQVDYQFQVRMGDDVVWTSPAATETLSDNETRTNSGSLAYDTTLEPEDAENFAPDDHVLTATVFEVGAGQGLPNVPVNFELTGPCGTIDPLTDTTDANGEASTTLSSTSSCTTSVRAWVNGSASASTAGFDTGEADAGADKRFVDYRVTVQPDAVNVVGSDHTFTALLEKDTGSGFESLAGETVTLALGPDADSDGVPDGNPDARIVAVNGTPRDPGTMSDSCTTRADDLDTPEDETGTCAVVIHSGETGSVTLVATFTTINDSGQKSFDSAGTKEYVDFRVNVTPETATNLIDAPHTFVVLLDKDSGDGFQPLAGETVTLALGPDTDSDGVPDGNPDARIVAANGTPRDPGTTSDSCTTRADDLGTPEDETGTCAVVVNSASPGSVALTGTFGIALDSGDLTRSDGGTKLYVDLRVNVTPTTATNLIGDPHTFVVLLDKDSGDGFQPLAGETVTLALGPDTDSDGVPDGNPDARIVAVNGTPRDPGTMSDSCTTRADDLGTPEDETGTCAVVVNSASPGNVVLTATWQGAVGDSTGSRSDGGGKLFVDIDLAKVPCPAPSPPGGVVEYAIAFSVTGGAITNVTLTDDLPAGTNFVSASNITGPGTDEAPSSAPDVGDPNGSVVWEFPSLAEGDYFGAVVVEVDDAVPTGQVITNSLDLTADGVSKGITQDLLVSDEAATAEGRAYGMRVNIGDGFDSGVVSDSDDANPNNASAIPDPFGGPGSLATLLSVAEFDESGDGASQYTAIATALDVHLAVPGVGTIDAESIVTKSTSRATGTSATSTSAGSTIQGLTVTAAGAPTPVFSGDVDKPTEIAINHPVTGAELARVFVLEQVSSGAASGLGQPSGTGASDAGLFASDLTVNGIHVVVNDVDGTPLSTASDVIVAHAEAQATFPSTLGCGVMADQVSGRAFALSLDESPAAGPARVAEVNLPSTGGVQGDGGAVTLPGVAAAGTATTQTVGEVNDGEFVTPGDGVAVQSASLARTEGLDLLGGMITATKVEASTASTLGGSVGAALIANLIIGGMDVCPMIHPDLEAQVCEPPPNTVLFLDQFDVIVMLNEQITGPGEITVNAVHIWVLGEANPLGLPAGAQVIISSSQSGAYTGSP